MTQGRIGARSKGQPIRWTAILGLAGLVFLSGCGSNKPRPIPPGDPSLPEIDVLQLKENSEEALRISQENRLQIQTLSAHLKEAEGRITAVAEELASLPWWKLDSLGRRIDSVRNALRILEDRVSRIPNVPPSRTLSTFSPHPEAAAGKKPESVRIPLGAKESQAVPEKPDSQVGQNRPASDGQNPPASGGKTPVAGQGLETPTSPEEMKAYKKAFDLFYAADYKAARKGFESITKQWPGGTYAANSLYWVGECDFALGNLESAIQIFAKVANEPSGSKADDAQLKLGYSWLKKGDAEKAKKAFADLLSLYPDSEYLERAREEMEKLR